jgi:Ser/Thr protein kinase RdoA (MazF antagonist)
MFGHIQSDAGIAWRERQDRMIVPASDTLLSANALAWQLNILYPLANSVSCALHWRGINDTYQVRVLGRLVGYLRVYRCGYRSLDEIEVELAVLAHLSHCGVAVSAPIARRDGAFVSTLQCTEGLRFAVLFTRAPGVVVQYEEYREEIAYNYGLGAARIFAGMETYRGPSLRKAIDVVSLIEEPLLAIRKVMPADSAGLALIAEIAERLRRRIEENENLTLGFCHADLHGQNASLENDVFTFYDFDWCGWGFRAYELSTFPWVFLLRQSNASVILQLGRAFLKGYASVLPPDAADLDALSDFMGVRHLWLMGLHSSSVTRLGLDVVGGRYFERQIAILKRWDLEISKLRANDWDFR